MPAFTAPSLFTSPSRNEAPPQRPPARVQAACRAGGDHPVPWLCQVPLQGAGQHGQAALCMLTSPLGPQLPAVAGHTFIFGSHRLPFVFSLFRCQALEAKTSNRRHPNNAARLGFIYLAPLHLPNTMVLILSLHEGNALLICRGGSTPSREQLLISLSVSCPNSHL